MMEKLPKDITAHLRDFYHMASTHKPEEDVLFPELTQVNSFSDKTLHAFGGMKKISTAKSSRTDRVVAIAELLPECRSQEHQNNFIREARITAALEHPNIVPIYDIAYRDNLPFFTMKYLHGESLKTILHALLKATPYYIEQFPITRLIEIYIKVCEAVSFAHSNGVLHLDIKPANIIVGTHGEVYLCDWGIAKVYQTEGVTTANTKLDSDLLNDITLTGEIKGTPGFMAPEQTSSKFGEKEERTDIYSLGYVLYNILTLRKPFHNKTSEEILYLVSSGQKPQFKLSTLWNINNSLTAVLKKATNTRIIDRYQCVDDLVSDLKSYLNGYITKVESPTALKSFHSFFKRHKELKFMSLFMLVMMTILVFVFVRNSQTSEEKDKKLTVLTQQKINEVKRQASNEISKTKLKYEKAHQTSVDLEQSIKQLKQYYDPQSISLNFTDGGKGFNRMKSFKAGVIPKGFWEASYGNQPIGNTDLSNLKNNLGIATGVELTISTDSHIAGRYFTNKLGFEKNMNDFSNQVMENWTEFSRGATLSLKGLNRFATRYDVIIYSHKPFKDYAAKISIGDEQVILGTNDETLNTFKNAHRKPESDGYSEGNYYIFRNLTKDSIDIKIERFTSHWVAVNGIQIIARKQK